MKTQRRQTPAKAKRHPSDRLMGVLFDALFLGALAVLVLGGCALNTQVVKVPVAVPCVDQPVQLEAVPLEGLTPTEAHELGAAGLWGDLADRVAATLQLLAADRLAQAAQLDGCSKIPAASAAGAH